MNFHLRGRRAPFLAVLTSLALLAAAVPAVAAYTKPRYVSPDGWNVMTPSVAVDRQGDAFMVWTRVAPYYPHSSRIQARTRSRSGRLGDPMLLSPRRHTADRPGVAVDDDGDAVVIWAGRPAGTPRIYARRVGRFGKVGSVQAVSPAGIKAFFANVAVDPDGDALVTWNEIHEDNSWHTMVRRLGRGGALGPVEELSQGAVNPDPATVALDRSGNALLVWVDEYHVYSRTVSSTGKLGSLETVYVAANPNDRNFAARVAVGRDGRGLVTWESWSQESLRKTLMSRRVNATGELGAVRAVSPPAHDVRSSDLASDLEGDVVVAWHLGSEALFARQVTRNGVFRDRVRVGKGAMSDIELDDDGNGVLVWLAPGVDNRVSSIFSAKVTRAGVFREPKVVSVTGGTPSVDGSADGDVVVVWKRGRGEYDGVQFAAGP